MARARKFKSVVPGGKPALRLEFSGRDQPVFFEIHRLAEKVGMKGNPFARLIVIDYMKRHKALLQSEKPERAKQLVMGLGIPKKEGAD